MRAALAVALALSLLASGCGGGEGAPNVVEVDIADFRFMPSQAEVRAGGRVTFGNGDVAPHTATAENRSDFDTGTLRTGDRKTIGFEDPGTFSYFCDFHPFMKGAIKVVD